MTSNHNDNDDNDNDNDEETENVVNETTTMTTTTTTNIKPTLEQVSPNKKDHDDLNVHNADDDTNKNKNKIETFEKTFEDVTITKIDNNNDHDEKELNIYEENKQQQQQKISSPSSESIILFPPPFYCPITKRVFQDPVVLPDGITYEREALKKDRSNDPNVDKNAAYPNRALKAVIDETVEMTGPSMRAGLKRMQHSMKRVFSQVLEKSLLPSDEYRPLPESYYCPITFNIMHDPVIDKEGNTFERVAVVNWIRANGTSPLTRTKMSPTDDALYPNTAIKDLLELEKNRDESSMHPSIRKWKEEEPPKLEDPELGGNLPNNSNNHNATTIIIPLSMEDLERLERNRRNRSRCTLTAMFFTVILFFLAIFYGGAGFVWICMCVIVCFCLDGRPENNNNNNN